MINNKLNLSWLPWQLPKNVYALVSCLPHKSLMKQLESKIKHNFIATPALEESTSLQLVSNWLSIAGRCLSTHQMSVVKDAICKCSLPLYTTLVFEEVRLWKSQMPAEKAILADTVQGMINQLLDRVENHHGKILTTSALAYITASQSGLSEVELVDILSLDDEVLNDVYVFWQPPVRRLPPLLWTRLRDALGSYLVEREAGRINVITWYHRQFTEVARSRYLSDDNYIKKIHSNMADYYLGVWGGGKPKPFVYTDRMMRRLSISVAESEADRMVPEQPLRWYDESKKTVTGYNLRVLEELPHHLIHSRRYKKLISDCLLNYTWLRTKHVFIAGAN